MIFRINMSDQRISYESIKDEYRYLGGRAFIARFLLNEVNPTCEPLGRHNKLVFVPGLLAGSKVFSSGRISIGGKSPLTGGIKESNGGGLVGVKLGRLGYKAIVIEELPKDDQKYLLYINKEGIKLLPAQDYWGLGVYETAKRLRLKYGEHIAISCIGSAGENRLLSAGIANTDMDGVPSRYSGRGGLGAVMGSKGIKALIIDDSGAKVINPVEPERFKEALKEYARLSNESPVIQTFTKYGTAANLLVANALGALPTRNFSTGSFEKADNISGERLYDIILERKGKPSHSCMPGCIIRCSNSYVDKTGKEIVAPLEYETIALMGANLEIDDLDIIAEMNYLCNDYGIDTIETGAAIGVAMAGGLIPFGDAQGAINLIHEIGKGSLTGRVIGNGALITGKVLGVTKVPVVKGQAMPGYEPRGLKGTAVTYATSPMGADHTAGITLRFKVDHHSQEGQVEASRKAQYTVPIWDDLGLCSFASAALGNNQELICEIVNSQLGISLNVEKLNKLANDTIKWELEFNQRAGFTKADDRLPEYFTETPNPSNNCIFDVSENDLDRVHE